MWKRLFTTISILQLILTSFSATWHPLGNIPSNASRICFGASYLHHVICTDDGMILYNISTQESEYFTYGGLPVWGAGYLGPTQMLIVMGNGSYSDGIWSFDWQTHQFEVIEWLVYPNFLYHDDMAHQFWVGSAWGGLYYSTDGWNWQEHPNFQSFPCLGMSGYGSHLMVTVIMNSTNFQLSDDSGVTWHYPEDYPLISDMCYSPGGILGGIFPYNYDESGLWFSDDFGVHWQQKFQSDYMSAVGFDCFGTCLVGWEAGQGLALYYPEAPPPGLVFLNDGLPSLNINRIQVNPTMSAPAIFVCTDAGAVWSNDYFLTGIPPENTEEPEVRLFPNPGGEEITAESSSPLFQVAWFNVFGQKIREFPVNSCRITLKEPLQIPGIYFLRIIFENGKAVTRKVEFY